MSESQPLINGASCVPKRRVEVCVFQAGDADFAMLHGVTDDSGEVNYSISIADLEENFHILAGILARVPAPLGAVTHVCVTLALGLCQRNTSGLVSASVLK